MRDAIGRASTRLNPNPARARQTAQQIEGQLVAGLTHLDPNQPTIAQLPKAPRLIETLGPLFAGGAATAAAPEEFSERRRCFRWIYVGLPERFPPLEAADLEELEQGACVLALYLDLVPYAQTAPEAVCWGPLRPTKSTCPIRSSPSWRPRGCSRWRPESDSGAGGPH